MITNLSNKILSIYIFFFCWFCFNVLVLNTYKILRNPIYSLTLLIKFYITGVVSYWQYDSIRNLFFIASSITITANNFKNIITLREYNIFPYGKYYLLCSKYMIEKNISSYLLLLFVRIYSFASTIFMYFRNKIYIKKRKKQKCNPFIMRSFC